MKKYLLLALLFLSTVWADVYYAKAEPLKKHLIKSNVSGKVIFANEAMEGTLASNQAIVLIDAAVDLKEKKRLENQTKLLNSSVKQNQEVFNKRFDYYKSIKNLGSKSKTSKDSAYYAQVAAKQTLISSLIEASNSKQALFTLNKQIDDKNITMPNWYVYDLHVLEGDFVTMGTPLITVADVSAVKLTIFLSSADALVYGDKELYIDNQKSAASLQQVWNMSDTIHMSSYEAVILLPSRIQLSQLVKVELK